jgi:hypothetical protein
MQKFKCGKRSFFFEIKNEINGIIYMITAKIARCAAKTM